MLKVLTLDLYNTIKNEIGISKYDPTIQAATSYMKVYVQQIFNFNLFLNLI